jgi:hypothetical protein
VVAAYNICPVTPWEGYVCAMYEALSEDGQAIVTFAEQKHFRNALPILEKYFNCSFERLWRGDSEAPHAYLVIGIRKKIVNLHKVRYTRFLTIQD